MQIGFIGLGKMGSNMVARLVEKEYEVVAYDINEAARQSAHAVGAQPADSYKELIEELALPRRVWLMVPHQAVEEVLRELTPLLQRGDTIIDGGNVFYKDSINRAAMLAEQGINFLDVGVSGGIDGARNGACMMIGGTKDVFEHNETLFKDLTVPNGYGYMGASGAGHYVKMVHNSIEYGMMGAIAEGLQEIAHAKETFGTDLSEVIKVYGHGSIIESRLISEWLAAAWKDNPGLDTFEGSVPHGETEEAMKYLTEKTRMPVLASALTMRIDSRDKPTFAARVINALRQYFGGHES